MRMITACGAVLAAAAGGLRSFFLILTVLLVPAASSAQVARSLSLKEALALAVATDEELEIARAGVARARANVDRADSQRNPQVNGSASYQRALASQFQGLGGGGTPELPPECIGPFEPGPDLSVEERLALLERRLACPPAGGFGGIDFSQLGFGAPNTWNLGLSLNWPFYTGGRIEALTRAAADLADVAELEVSATEAQTMVEVTAAYFEAQLADELLSIAQSSLDQAEETLRITSLRTDAGAQPEFELLQTRVARDNQRPQVIRAETVRDLAFARLRTLLDLPQDQPLELTTPITEAGTRSSDVETDAARRAPVRQAESRLEAATQQLRAARAQRRPSVAVQSQYGLVAFTDSFFPDTGDFRDDWTVGAALQIPIFDGGRIRADIASARADVAEAEAQLDLVRELAELDSLSALAELRAARATFEATDGTVEQALRGYELAQLRYREGVSILLEVQSARLLLQQARANRAQAARDLWVAHRRVSLLAALPLGAGASTDTGMLPSVAGQSPTGPQTGFTDQQIQRGSTVLQRPGVQP